MSSAPRTGRSADRRRGGPRSTAFTRFAVVAILGGCRPDASGSYVDIQVHSDSAELCAGTVEHLDRFIERVFAFLGEPVPDNFVVPVEIFSEQQPCDIAACYDGGKVWLRFLDTGWWDRPSWLLRHELVHAVHRTAWGNAAPFFNEGLAQALSSLVSSRPGSMAIGDMLDKPAEEVDYDEAGRFVRFLIETRGIAQFRRLFQGSAGKDAAGLRAWIAEVYGDTFADIEAEFLSGALRCHYQLHLCDSTEVERVTDSWSLDVLASCHEPDFYGAANSGADLFATSRTLELVQDGRYQVTPQFAADPADPASQAARVTFVHCGTCEQVSVQELRSGEYELQLSAGVFALEVIMPYEREVTVELVRLGD